MKLSTHLMAATAALASVGCLDTTSPPQERLGFVALTSYDAGAGAYALRAVGGFYNVNGLAFGFPTEESCVSALYAPSDILPTDLPTLDAGIAVEYQVSGVTDSLFRSTTLGVTTYATDDESTPFVPGDTLTLDVPGAIGGYPAGSLQIRTADAFTPSALADPTPGQALAVGWTPSPASGTSMTLSLRYASTAALTEPDRQIFCAFVDDGASEIGATLSDIWGGSPVGTRAVAWSRVRVEVVALDPRTALGVVSTFDQPLLPVP